MSPCGGDLSTSWATRRASDARESDRIARPDAMPSPRGRRRASAFKKCDQPQRGRVGERRRGRLRGQEFGPPGPSQARSVVDSGVRLGPPAPVARTETGELVTDTPRAAALASAGTGRVALPHARGVPRQGVFQHLGSRGHTILTGPTGGIRTTRVARIAGNGVDEALGPVQVSLSEETVAQWYGV